MSGTASSHRVSALFNHNELCCLSFYSSNSLHHIPLIKQSHDQMFLHLKTRLTFKKKLFGFKCHIDQKTILCIITTNYYFM